MLVEENTIKSTLSYNDDKSKRYSLNIEWDNTKKHLCIIMLSAGQSNGIHNDKTTNLVIKNVCTLEYGSVEIVNLFSYVDGTKEDKKDKDNLSVIDISAKRADIVIFAVGTGYKTNKKIAKRQSEVLAILKRYDKKLYCISDNDGNKFYHPLCPKVNEWNLTKFDVEELTRKGYEDD